MSILAADKRLRKSHIWKRQGEDHYVEPSWTSLRLLEVESFDTQHPMLDACTGFGTVAESGKQMGYQVLASDVVDRGYPSCTVEDFLTRKSVPPDCSCVCNPPFNLVREFADHAHALGIRKFAFIFPVARLNAARWLKDLPLRRVWLLTPRPSMPPGFVIARGEKPGGGKVDFAWIVFERGYAGSIEIDWLHRDGSS